MHFRFHRINYFWHTSLNVKILNPLILGLALIQCVQFIHYNSFYIYERLHAIVYVQNLQPFSLSFSLSGPPRSLTSAQPCASHCTASCFYPAEFSVVLKALRWYQPWLEPPHPHMIRPTMCAALLSRIQSSVSLPRLALTCVSRVFWQKNKQPDNK